jgi:curved DNA-binding protein CbpA
MPAFRSHYDILNVSHDAESVVIEAAYRALMKRYHPDQGPTPGEGVPSAARINEAFSVLRDPERRVEYDHKEWVRTQNIQLAQYPPPSPPRQSNFFGWGGWLVALLLAGAIALIAGRSGGVPPISNGEEARARGSAEPELRSQPLLPKEATVSPAQEAAIRADAWRQTVAPSAPREPGPAEAADAAEPVPLPATEVHRNRTSRAGDALRRRAGHSDSQVGKDFLERQGGIY